VKPLFAQDFTQSAPRDFARFAIRN
jgi:hypothetical protein